METMTIETKYSKTKFAGLRAKLLQILKEEQKSSYYRNVFFTKYVAKNPHTINNTIYV